MPIYEYECPKCGTFEHEASITADPLKRCPQCRRKVTKQISLSSFALKGGGWYADSYKGGKAKNGNGAKAEPAAACESCPAAAGSSASAGGCGGDS